jgi:hypothetical protein
MIAVKSLLVLVAFAACNGQAAAEAEGEDAGTASKSAADSLHVGLAKVDITPPLGYPMSGYYYGRGATGILDPLHAKAFVLHQGPAEAAIVVCDLIGISADLCQMVRQRASVETGIPAANIMLAATHCHTGPDYYRELRQYVRGDNETDARESQYAAPCFSRAEATCSSMLRSS